MSAEEEQECPECPAGLPAYLATFADLMSLLMCFFVLLLAFSEMNVEKYKQLSGSMKSAFGVQAEVKTMEIPKGTSIIAKEFSPGRPDPTILNEVRQHTDEITKSNLEILCAEGSQSARESQAEKSKAEAVDKLLAKLVAQTQADAVEAAMELKNEIMEGKVEIETKGRKIVIRIKEKGSFSSGSAILQDEFIPVMDKIRNTLKTMKGTFAVTGHTDDVPISTYRFRSNWELSSSRAVSVAQELLKTGEMDPTIFSVVGMGDVKPLGPNTSRESRAKNRRVEIVVAQDMFDDKILSGEMDLPDDEEFTPELIREAGLTDLDGFEIYSEDADGNQTNLKNPEEELNDIEREMSVYDDIPLSSDPQEVEAERLDVQIQTPAQVTQPAPRRNDTDPFAIPQSQQRDSDPVDTPILDDTSEEIEEFF